MRPGSYLINTARGGLVVEADLAESLASGHLAGAGLDVLNDEPPGPDNPLLGLSNVVFSPHIGGIDVQAMADMAEMAARCIVELSRRAVAARVRRQRRAGRELELVRRVGETPVGRIIRHDPDAHGQSGRAEATCTVPDPSRTKHSSKRVGRTHPENFPGLRTSRRSDLERAAAAAGLDDVRVVEDEPALLQAVVEVDDGAVEVGVELLVDGELDAVDVDDPVALAGAGVEVQAVGETAAAAPLDADAKDGLLGQVLLGDDLLDFDWRPFRSGSHPWKGLLVGRKSRVDRDRPVG